MNGDSSFSLAIRYPAYQAIQVSGIGLTWLRAILKVDAGLGDRVAWRLSNFGIAVSQTCVE